MWFAAFARIFVLVSVISFANGFNSCSFGLKHGLRHRCDFLKAFCKAIPRHKPQNIYATVQSNFCSRRVILATSIAFALQTFNAQNTDAAALSGANPEDKAKLIEVAEAINKIGAKISSPDSWSEIAQTLSQPPFTKEALDKLFNLAAKSLPPNIQKIYGGDGGQWVGLKNEAVDAMDALAAEINYLQKQYKQGSSDLDTTDLQGYYELVKSKTSEFLALYSNSKLNATLKGVGFCAYSSSAKCDDYDEDKDVKEAARQGGIYNEFRYGSRERAVGGGVSADSATIKAYGQESLLHR